MIAAIELAMLARLKAVADAGAYDFPRWRTLSTYPDNWDAYLESDAQIACPAAWVVFAGWQGTEDDGDDQVRVLRGSFGLMVADENLRADEAYQRHGGPDPAKEPGSYRLILGAVAALSGQTLGLDLYTPLEAGPLRAVRPTDALRKRKLSMYAVEFTCDFPLIVVGDGETDPAALEALHANWDIPLFGQPLPVDRDPVAPGVQLPDDYRADATDHLELEQE
ncbi:phage protein Gp37 [Sphingomonas hengshuiensis]|uniref:phage protein Gp37 n=1 Tax=Sphingomonas hengshuiensis TaxID=1609977 RepID=UPI000697973D|nr:phage protein Gp37 [Sphingomonas hengshuiensis]